MTFVGIPVPMVGDGEPAVDVPVVVVSTVVIAVVGLTAAAVTCVVVLGC